MAALRLPLFIELLVCASSARYEDIEGGMEPKQRLRKRSILQCPQLCHLPDPDKGILGAAKAVSTLGIPQANEAMSRLGIAPDWNKTRCYYDKIKALKIFAYDVATDCEDFEVVTLLWDHPRLLQSFCSRLCKPVGFGQPCQPMPPTSVEAAVAEALQSPVGDVTVTQKVIAYDLPAEADSPTEAKARFNKLQALNKNDDSMFFDFYESSPTFPEDDEFPKVGEAQHEAIDQFAKLSAVTKDNNLVVEQQDDEPPDLDDAQFKDLEKKLAVAGDAAVKRSAAQVATKIRQIEAGCRNKNSIDFCCMKACLNPDTIEGLSSVSAFCVRFCTHQERLA